MGGALLVAILAVGDSSMSNDPTTTEVADSVGGGAVSTLIQRLAGRSIHFGFQVLLSRTLGADLYGTFSFGQSILRIFHMLLSTGPMNAVVRFVSEFVAQSSFSRAKGRLIDAIALSVGLGVAVVAGVLVVDTLPSCSLFGMGGGVLGALGLLISLPAYNTLLLLSSAGRALGAVGFGVFLYDILQPAAVLLGVGAFFLLQASLGNAVLGFTVGMYVACLIAVVLLWRRVPDAMKTARASHDVKGVALYALLAGVSGVGFIVLSRIDRIMLGVLSGTAETGIYTAASVIAFQVTLGMKALEAAVAPELVKLHAGGKQDQLKALYSTTARWSMAVTIPLIVPMISFPREILAIFGGGFPLGASVLIVLAAGQLVRTSIGCSEQILLMTGHQKTEAWNGILLVVVNAGLNAILIPRLGALGAASATSLSLVLMTLLRLVQIRRLLGFLPATFAGWKPIVAGGLSVVVGMLMRSVGLHFVWKLLLGTALIIATYALALLMMGLDDEMKGLLGLLTKRIGRSR